MNDVPTVAEFQERMKGIMEKYPYLVIEKNNVIQGNADISLRTGIA